MLFATRCANMRIGKKAKKELLLLAFRYAASLQHLIMLVVIYFTELYRSATEVQLGESFFLKNLCINKENS